MFQFASSGDAVWQLFLFSFAVSVLLIAQRFLQLLFKKAVSPTQEWLNTGFSIVVIAVLAVDAATSLRLEETPVLNRILQVGIVVLTILVSGLFVHLAFGGRLGSREWRIPSLIVLLIAAFASAAWSSHRFYASVSPELVDSFEHLSIPGKSVPSTKFVAVTDQGREVDVLRWVPETDQDYELIRSMMTQALTGFPRTIQRAENDVRSNCHGWVFTGGRFLLRGDGVARILEDNGYEEVTDPRIGDIVIYRIPDGEISHTGLVQGVLGDGTVIVESKWSVGGRFLHRPEDQPYSTSYKYYRTERPNHVVTIRFKDPVATSEIPDATMN